MNGQFSSFASVTMKSLIVFLVLIFGVKTEKISFTTIEQLEDQDTKIISGQYALPGQFPWQAAIHIVTSGGLSHCGGALIHERWILTAAHCTDGGILYTVSLGSIYRGSVEQIGQVMLRSTKAIVHEKYNKNNLNNDIALLELDTSVTFSENITKIALADSSEYLPAGVPVIVSGWGRTNNSANSISPTLKFANLTTISNNVCGIFYNSTGAITNSTLCAIGDRFRSTCNGDSGGPLITRKPNGQVVHSGIISFVSLAGCNLGMPSGYVRTASYRDWINSKINGGDSGNGSNSRYNAHLSYYMLFIALLKQLF